MQKKSRLHILFIFISLFLFGACSAQMSKPSGTSRTLTESQKSQVLPRLCFRPNAVPLEKRVAENNITEGIPLYIRIFKQEKILELWAKRKKRYILLKSYPICKYSGKLGPKQRSGDRQAPEGVYALTPKSLQPNSHYHLALNIDYPNCYDRQHHRTGDLIMIHGKCSSTGCFAMGNHQIEEIYHMVEAAFRHGVKFIYVSIYPFRMDEAHLSRRRHSYWYPFWKNLQEGYRMFEATHVPPFTGVCKGRYIFRKRGKDLIVIQENNITKEQNLTNLTKN